MLTAQLYFALYPLLSYYIAIILGPTWTVPLCYQVFQSLLCEKRKWDNHSKQQRRENAPSRAKAYSHLLKQYLLDVGIKYSDAPQPLRNQPTYSVPSDTYCVAEIEALLDFWVALLLRFAKVVLQKTPRCPRKSASAMLKDARFMVMRLNQFAFQLDHGSLATWDLVLRPHLQVAGGCRSRAFGWASCWDVSWGRGGERVRVLEPACLKRLEAEADRAKVALMAEGLVAGMQKQGLNANPAARLQDQMKQCRLHWQLFLVNVAASSTLLAGAWAQTSRQADATTAYRILDGTSFR
eukprot:TRINITY_DN114643_c0_g1_i1.p1 TRINITY_DN114643_c0_g1~~TRINITY_DN114643_c0_g1_i1.p1  ORF type:complete len:295 (+),score=40.48 TRINITY_DN114643_c0_g1_i1:70-954(+)